MKNITIVIIDSQQYGATEFALKKTRQALPTSPVVYFSDRKFLPDDCQWVETPKFDGREHCRICLQDVNPHVNTDYALYIQYDGFVVNPGLFNWDFLKYDYIGAPWFGWPKNASVGNGGFSLRSRRLLELTPHLPFNRNSEDTHDWLEDKMIAVKYRPWLEQQGIKFAPEELAATFSIERPFGRHKTWGFHGLFQVPHYLDKADWLEWYQALHKDIRQNPNYIHFEEQVRRAGYQVRDLTK